MSDHYLESMYKRATPISMIHRNRLNSICQTIENIAPDRCSRADFGCANGFLREQVLHQCEVNFSRIVGFDHAPEMIEEANTRDLPTTEFRHFEMPALRDPTEKFDVVSCFETLEHVGDHHDGCG